MKRIGNTCHQGTLSNLHFDLVTRLTKSAYDAYFVKHKERLKRKSDLLKPKPQTLQPRRSLVTKPFPAESVSLLLRHREKAFNAFKRICLSVYVIVPCLRGQEKRNVTVYR